jgi:NAD+ synthase
VDKISINDVINIDYNHARKTIENFLANELEKSKRSGYVIGLSGGVDSATSYFLAAEAVGIDKVLALIMPDSTVTPKEDVDDAKELVKILKGKVQIIDINPIVEVYKSTIPAYEEKDVVPLGNIRARIRMTLLYFYANKLSSLVLGTGDRSEETIGYFTKYGDGGVDVLPISTLLKSQVRRLAVNLGVPEKIAFKPSSPRLWSGQEAEKELGVSYDTVDLIIYSIFDKKIDIDVFVKNSGINRAVVEMVLDMNKRSEHKRSLPSSLDVKSVIKYIA